MARKKRKSKKRRNPKTKGKAPASDRAVEQPEAVEEEPPAEPPSSDSDEDDREKSSAPVDAVLDDDIDDSEDLDQLIAATVAGAAPEDHPEDPEVTPLDSAAKDEALSGAPSTDLPPSDLPPSDGEPATVPLDDDALHSEGISEPGAAAEAPTEPEPSGPRDPDEGEVAAGAQAHGDVSTSEGVADGSVESAPSEEDLEGALDLGPASTPELRDRLLAQALAHAEQQEARYRVPLGDPRPARRLKAAVATALFLLAVTFAVAPPAWVQPEPPARIDAAQRLRDIRTSLLLQAEQVDAYWLREQRLPPSLDEVSQRLPGVRYVRSGNRVYQLVAYQPNGEAVVYDSSDPAAAFAEVRPPWTRPTGAVP